MDTALSLAGSPEPYERAARRIGGTATELQKQTAVGGSGQVDILALPPRQATPTAPSWS